MIPKRKINPVQLGLLGVLAVTAAYLYIYQAQPLGTGTWGEAVFNWNDVVLNLSYGFAAGLGAVAATLIWRHFEPSDRPRATWGYFALALWAWTAAEIVWALYALRLGDEMPTLTPADIFWFIGYGFFAAALLHQYRLIFHPTRAREGWAVVGGTLVVLLASLIAAAATRQLVDVETTWPETYVTIFYPLGDLAVVLAALALVRTFGWGLWGRTWLGLLVFAASDALYAVLEITGVYSALSASGDPLSLLADVVYFAAYLLVALVCYAQWRLLKYGPAEA